MKQLGVISGERHSRAKGPPGRGNARKGERSAKVVAREKQQFCLQWEHFRFPVHEESALLATEDAHFQVSDTFLTLQKQILDVLITEMLGKKRAVCMLKKKRNMQR